MGDAKIAAGVVLKFFRQADMPRKMPFAAGMLE
jgi:hypothetical protein